MAAGMIEVTNQDDAFAGVTYVTADENDDVASIRTRLEAVSGRRVALVLAGRSDAIETPAAMHVVARVAAAEGINLAIVSARQRTRFLAEMEGLPAFSSTRAIPGYVRRARNNPLEPLGGLVQDFVRYVRVELSWIFAVFMVLAIVAFGLAMIPHAQVTVRPFTERIDGTVPFQATVGASAVDPVKGLIPSRQVYLVVNASGSVPVPSNRALDGYAVGFVTFTNQTKGKVFIPKGTDVSTYAGTHFATVDDATLEGRLGAQATVRVRAKQPGPASNVKADTILQVNGPQSGMFLVVNDVDMAGGGAGGVPVVTAWEKQRLLDQVTAKAGAVAKSRLGAQTNPGEMVVPETVQVTPIFEAFDHQIGQPATSLSVQTQFRAEAMIVNQDQIRQLAIQTWNPTIPNGFGVRPGSVQVDPANVVKVEARTVVYSVPIHAVIFKTVNPNQIADEVRLRSVKAARADLSHVFDLASPPTVTITPNWIGRAYRVDVVVDTSAPPAPAAEPRSSNAAGTVVGGASGTAPTDQAVRGSSTGAR